MSTVVPSKGHRHTQSALSPSPAASSKNPQNPHHLNLHSHAQNSQSEMSDSYQSNPTTPPRTPRRNDQSSQNRTIDTGSKQKSRNKIRPKAVLMSPAGTQKGRSTPPLTSVQSGGMMASAKPMSTPSTMAYAGATFHASPAPSALPIPSFYSKSVPDSPGMKGFKVKAESLSDSPTPPLPALNTPSQQKAQFQREESPLDFFFKADREQKARTKSASSTQNTVSATGPFNPPRPSPRVSHTPPATRNQASPSTIFAMELDGDGSAGSPIGPAFSTPYAERIKAARPRQPFTPEGQSAFDRSEALKAYLFSGQQPPSMPTAPVNLFPAAQTSPVASPSSIAPLYPSKSAGYSQRSHQNNFPLPYDSKPPIHAPRPSGRSSGLRQEVTPSKTPTKPQEGNAGYPTSPIPSRTYGNANSSDQNNFIGSIKSHTSPHGVSSVDRSADIQGMEDSLRKLLKLDSAGSSGVGSLPGATVSAPNYVGGRPRPSLNGMHDGVMGS
ncbi:hypothetical protein D0Z07_5483 [Hyphodiscus hymeniophilus]|uniref:Proteophosphoglycan 5 n=1 Tax=Hyphodiscus hymeniophilus TaxID=353542 RepID=A0A9P7AWJ2_9HELO|nr:hypothetical protein D0Z07_5483 [Hyphodiscus hymeniophilus]